MSAKALKIVTLVLPNPDPDPNSIQHQHQVDGSFSFAAELSGDIRTLSTHSASAGDDRTGLLYVPDLAGDGLCTNSSARYFPSNVTRLPDLPQDSHLIAIAPWLSPDCTLRYLQASSFQSALSAFVFFLPELSSSAPPPANNIAWGLGDGGQWKQRYPFPVYAIPSGPAMAILYQMSLYSGNMSSAPYGPALTANYPPSDYVRLQMSITTNSLSSGTPSIWALTFIVLAVLVAATGVASGAMHIVQRARRRDLGERISRGEVDLRTVGIKKITVPPKIIDTFPVYAYPPPESHAPATLKQQASDTSHGNKDTVNVNETSVATTSTKALFQPTCAICLEDFLESQSRVRQLPCRHIFHPECIDTFLRENASICPMCKQSTLPRGYCPVKITDMMVKRERDARRQQLYRQRYQRAQPSSTADSTLPELESHPQASTDMELIATAVVPGRAPPTAVSNHGRREWARTRALAMLGPHAPPTTDHDDIEQEEHRPQGSRARVLLRRVFPTLA
ncbi:hypothetical protein AAFC00_003508 [Neodothiora populina]|uniref:RING-type domain-containing protein n=1 Tax=Neodothiora populina TaxID=2781224 RepID=A0ABR3PEN7_9PEZI